MKIVNYYNDRVENQKDPRTKERVIDKNFDDLFKRVEALSSEFNTFLTSFGGGGGGGGGAVTMATVESLRNESREFALMVGYE